MGQTNQCSERLIFFISDGHSTDDLLFDVLKMKIKMKMNNDFRHRPASVCTNEQLKIED